MDLPAPFRPTTPIRLPMVSRTVTSLSLVKDEHQEPKRVKGVMGFQTLKGGQLCLKIGSAAAQKIAQIDEDIMTILLDLFIQHGPCAKQAYFEGIKFRKMSRAVGKHQWTILEVFEI